MSWSSLDFFGAGAFRLNIYFWSQSFQTLSFLSAIRAWSFLAQFFFRARLEPKFLRVRQACCALKEHFNLTHKQVWLKSNHFLLYLVINIFKEAWQKYNFWCNAKPNLLSYWLIGCGYEMIANRWAQDSRFGLAMHQKLYKWQASLKKMKKIS